MDIGENLPRLRARLQTQENGLLMNLNRTRDRRLESGGFPVPSATTEFWLSHRLHQQINLIRFSFPICKMGVVISTSYCARLHEMVSGNVLTGGKSYY